MIEINLLKQGHGIIFEPKRLEKHLAYGRSKTLLLLILLLATLTLYLHPSKSKSSPFNSDFISRFFAQLDVVWFEENVVLFNNKASLKTVKGAISDIADEIVSGKPKTVEIYTIQISLVDSEKTALAIQKRLRIKGFQTHYGVKKQLERKSVVVIGPYKNRKNAKNVLKKVQNMNISWEIQKTENNKFLVFGPSFNNSKQAGQLIKRINKKGLKSDIIQKRVPVERHEVQVGRFQKREEAVQMLSKLLDVGLKGSIIKR